MSPTLRDLVNRHTEAIFSHTPSGPSLGQQAQSVEVLRTRTSPRAIRAASPASTKRKRVPRPKLDNEKCARCRKDKVKCSPQPRAWPDKCERCSSKGFECSPGEVKRRATRKPSPNSLVSPGSASTHQDVSGLEIREQIRPVSAKPHVHDFLTSWDCTALTNLVTFVQLLKYERLFFAKVVCRLERLAPELGRPQYDSASLQAQAIDQDLPQLMKDIQRILRHRQDSESLTMNDRILYENAHEAVDEDFVVPKHDPTSQELPVGVQIRYLVRRLRLDIRHHGSCDFRPLVKLVSRLTDEAPAWRARFGSPDYRVHGTVLFSLYHTINRAVFGLVLSPEFLNEPLILDWVLHFILENGIRTLPFSITRFAEVWDADDDSFDLDPLAADDTGRDGQFRLLHVAVLCNKPGIVRALTKDKRYPGPKLTCTLPGSSLFLLAASVGSVNCYRELLQSKDARILKQEGEGDTDSPLHAAARNGHRQSVAFILSTHIDDRSYVNKRARMMETPLMQAAGSGKYDVVQFLLDYPGVDIAASDTEEKTALAYASEHEEIFRLILSRLPDRYFNTLDDNGKTPLHWLAEYIGGKVMGWVLSSPSILPDQYDELGGTPLCHAVRGGNLEVVKILGIRRDVDVTKLSTCKMGVGDNYIEYARGQARKDNHYSQILDWLKINYKELEADLADWEIRNENYAQDARGSEQHTGEEG